MSIPLEAYALIGDCETAALVSRDGSIDWLCWPRFDSGACFAALLGGPEHGRWRIAPAGPATIARRYRDASLVLETEFQTEHGTVLLIDCMPPRGEASSHVVRMLVGKSGRVRMHMEMILRFDYGALVPWVRRLKDETLHAIAGPDMVVLRTTAPIRGEKLTTVADFEIGEGEEIPFVLTYGKSHRPPPRPIDAWTAIDATDQFWRDWVARCTYDGPWARIVRRSLIVLKALTYAPTGGIVAAPTTSLPERLGGERNWDYRYCWVRDATLTLLALMDAGYYDEARSWGGWLLRAAAGTPSQLQIMYGLGGERRLTEWIADWLPGYANSRPVRIGNQAAQQLQLDVYGELVDALYQARKGDVRPGEPAWALITALMRHLETIWREPDESIWEVRDDRRHFTYSKVMAWVAFDRAVKSIETFGLEGPLDRWRAIRDEIHQDVCTNGYDAERGRFVQSYGSKQLDGSLLLLPQVGFLPIDDPRIARTIAAIERHLERDGFVLRYDTARVRDGLPPGEGAFLACSFWLVDAMLMQGRIEEATRKFERLVGLANDLGLLAEEYDPRLKRQVGNFPQAFSHVALLNSALNLAHAMQAKASRTEQRKG